MIPRRTSLLPDRGVLIVSFATHKQKTLFFFLVQVCSLSSAAACRSPCISAQHKNLSSTLCSDERARSKIPPQSCPNASHSIEGPCLHRMLLGSSFSGVGYE